jgi:histidine triad (HIT) family protein
MPTDSLFARIARRETPARIVYQDDEITAFHDIHPAAPVHVLIVPNRVIPTLNDAAPEDQALLGRLFLVAQQLARELGVDQSGYRVVMNTNGDAGQSVAHIHLHLLGGRRLAWPPG